MARLRQQYPGNYTSSSNISTEFENIVRYIVSAERGNRTLGEMLAQLFDDEGDVDAPIELRLDAAFGLQYRVGIFTSSQAEEGWTTVVPLDEIRGAPGSDVGLVPVPILHSRADYTATVSQTDFSYSHNDSDELLVYKNGLLLRPGALFDYTSDPDTDLVELTSGASGGDKITIFKIRSEGGVSTTRTDTTPASSQTVFGYSFPTGGYQLSIYKNGLLLREGGSYDYVINEGTSTITFMSPVLSTDTVTFLEFSSADADSVTGFMLEGIYTDATTGLIPFTKISVDNDAIPQAKVSGLTAALTSKAKITISSTSPVSPTSGDLWHDTSIVPNALKFWDGTSWISTSPESSLPAPIPANAGQFVKVNGTGTGFLLSDIDFSALISRTEIGAAGGVAELDSFGIVPEAQLPEVKAVTHIYHLQSGSVSNADYTLSRIFKNKLRITGVSAQLASGSCTIQLKIGGTLVGSTHAITSATLDQSLATPIEVDALSASKAIAVTVTSGSSPTNLEVTLTTEIL